MKFRSSLQKTKGLLDYRLPLYPFSSIFSIVFLIGIAAAMALSPDTRIALIVGPLWIIILTAFFYGKGYHKKAQPTKVNKKVS
jgi:AAT family amino acid transporter